MRKFTIKSEKSLTKQKVSKLIESYFGEIDEKEDNSYLVTNPNHSVLNEIYIEINKNENTLLLDITEKELSYIESNDLLSEVPDATTSKNKFLKKVTGKTVEDRKKEWRRDVLPTEESIIRYS